MSFLTEEGVFIFLQIWAKNIKLVVIGHPLPVNVLAVLVGAEVLFLAPFSRLVGIAHLANFPVFVHLRKRNIDVPLDVGELDFLALCLVEICKEPYGLIIELDRLLLGEIHIEGLLHHCLVVYVAQARRQDRKVDDQNGEDYHRYCQAKN